MNPVISYETIINNKSLPKVTFSKNTSPKANIQFYRRGESYYRITVGKSSAISGEMHENAKILAEHIGIIEESRDEIRKGNIVSWNELKKKHGQKKRE